MKSFEDPKTVDAGEESKAQKSGGEESCEISFENKVKAVESNGKTENGKHGDDKTSITTECSAQKRKLSDDEASDIEELPNKKAKTVTISDQIDIKKQKKKRMRRRKPLADFPAELKVISKWVCLFYSFLIVFCRCYLFRTTEASVFLV